MGKLRVLLVPDFLPWILGTWAEQIAHLGTQHDYYFFSESLLRYYPEQWQYLIQNVDIVHFLSPNKVNEFSVPAGLPSITSVHHVVDWEKLAYLSQADAMMVVANEWKEFVQAKGLASERIFLFNNGVDRTKFYPRHNKALSRKQLGIDSKAYLIGYAAKFMSDVEGRKGIDVFLEALKRIAPSNQKLGVLITGPGWDLAVRQIRQYGFEVYYHPFLPDRLMPVFYNALDCYLVTSRIEGGPVPLLESMACGTPVITTPVGIVKDYIQDGVNGIVVSKNNPDQIVQAILQLIETPELGKQLSTAGLQTIDHHLTWAKTLAGIEHMYNQVWQNSANPVTQFTSNFQMDPAKQRNWAVNVDSYLWYQQLYIDGYYWEGMLGMVEHGLRTRGERMLRLLPDTLSALVPKVWKDQLKQRLAIKSS